MATLLDELQADFLDSDPEGENEEDVEEEHENGFANRDIDGDAEMAEEEIAAQQREDARPGDQQERVNRALNEAEDDEEAKSKIEQINLRSVSDFKSVANLWKSLKPIIEQIDEYQALSPEDQAKRNMGKSDSPAYKLMGNAGQLSSQIDTEIIILHKWIRDHYSAFFAGLERLVENPVAYAKAVAIIGNGPMDTKNVGTSKDNITGQSLDKVLDKAQLMSVRMEAATTTTKPLPESEMAMIAKACEMVIAADTAKARIRSFIEGRMTEFAPNLSTLIGAETAALLVQTAGGLEALARTPSSNLANIGWKTSRTGFATNAHGGGARQKGYIFYSPIIKNVPIDHRTQAIRIVAAKIALAARSDAVSHDHTSNAIGKELRDQVALRLDNLTNSAPNRGPRALPAPDDKPARKRGGRRARKAKEQFAVTELQKNANKLHMSATVAEADYNGEGLGAVGQQDTGKIRQTAVDKRTKARLSKKTQAQLGSVGASGLASSLRGFGQGGGTVTGLRTSGVGTSLGGGAGTASVIAFTDTSFGLELADPRARDALAAKRKAEEDTYFKSGTFTNVGGGTASMLPQENKVDSSGFKVPALPALKRVKKT